MGIFSPSCYKGRGMELVNTDQQMTSVTNVTLACDVDKQSCYKGY